MPAFILMLLLLYENAVRRSDSRLGIVHAGLRGRTLTLLTVRLIPGQATVQGPFPPSGFGPAPGFWLAGHGGGMG